MIRIFIIMLVAFSISARAQTETATNAAIKSGGITVQEIIVSGPPQLRMHSLAMISQGNIKGEIDESYLPGLQACATDSSAPIRSIAARLLGQYFVSEQEHPNPEALAILKTLANDESSDVRYNAFYYGLTQVTYKTPELVELLIDMAATHPQETLVDRIIVSLANYQPQAKEILDRKLKEKGDIAYFEIYEDLTGTPPPDEAQFLDMPSSRPRMYIVNAGDLDPADAQAQLTKALKDAGIKNPNVDLSGSAQNHVLMITTHITRDQKIAERVLANNDSFKLTQKLWLTPELQIQLEAMRKR